MSFRSFALALSVGVACVGAGCSVEDRPEPFGGTPLDATTSEQQKYFVPIFFADTSGADAATKTLPGSNWLTGAAVMNNGSQPTTVTAIARGYSGGQYTEVLANGVAKSTVEIGAGQSFVYLGQTFAGMPAGFVGSLELSADQPLAIMVNANNDGAGQTAKAMYQGTPAGATNKELLFPVAKNDFYGRETTFYVQNTEAATAAITANFNLNGTVYSKSLSVSPGRVVRIRAADARSSAGKAPPAGNTFDALGNLVVSGDRYLAGAMYEHPSGTSAPALATATRALAHTDIDSVALCPTVKRDFWGADTGIAIHNAASTQQNIEYELISDSRAFEDNVVVPPGQMKALVKDGLTTTSGLYAARVVSPGLMGVMVNEAHPGKVLSMPCLAESEASTVLVYPAYKTPWYGRHTGIRVQNADAVPIEAYATYKTVKSQTTHRTKPFRLEPGEGKTLFKLPAEEWDGAPVPENDLAAVTIRGSGLMVGAANESAVNRDQDIGGIALFAGEPEAGEALPEWCSSLEGNGPFCARSTGIADTLNGCQGTTNVTVRLDIPNGTVHEYSGCSVHHNQCEVSADGTAIRAVHQTDVIGLGSNPPNISKGPMGVLHGMAGAAPWQ